MHCLLTQHVLAHPAPLQVLNKVDLVEEEEVARLTRVFTQASDAVQAVLPCTALDGAGVEAVRSWAAGVVPEGPPLYDKARGMYYFPSLSLPCLFFSSLPFFPFNDCSLETRCPKVPMLPSVAVGNEAALINGCP